ncbi:MAG TPA: hypothetical protein VK395_22310 [Gemmataceae bacterium]|nr:hypothetical protein [Gemmataceae bacterium]
MRYFDRTGRPISKEQWAAKFRDRRYAVVCRTDTPAVCIVTSWVGLRGDTETRSLLFQVQRQRKHVGRPWETLNESWHATEKEARAEHDLLERATL